MLCHRMVAYPCFQWLTSTDVGNLWHNRVIVSDVFCWSFGSSVYRTSNQVVGGSNRSGRAFVDDFEPAGGYRRFDVHNRTPDKQRAGSTTRLSSVELIARRATPKG
jgi:hypothetical protein